MSHQLITWIMAQKDPTKLQPTRQTFTLINPNDVSMEHPDGKPFTVYCRRFNGETFDMMETVVEELREKDGDLTARCRPYLEFLDMPKEEQGKEVAKKFDEIMSLGAEYNRDRRRLGYEETVRIAREAIDPSVGLSEEMQELVTSPWDSPFWRAQDTPPLREAGRRFRTDVGLA